MSPGQLFHASATTTRSRPSIRFDEKSVVSRLEGEARHPEAAAQTSAGGAPAARHNASPPLSTGGAQPPQTIISEPVQIAECWVRAAGTLAPAPVESDEAAHESVAGLYRPPVLSSFELPPPPHTIISDPVHTAVWP